MCISRARACRVGGAGQPQAESLTRNLVMPATASAKPPFDAIELWGGSRGRPGGLRLLGDDFLFDFVVRCPENDVLVHQIQLGAIRAPVDDLLRIGVPDAGKWLGLIFGGSVDIELLGCWSGTGCLRR